MKLPIDISAFQLLPTHCTDRKSRAGARLGRPCWRGRKVVSLPWETGNAGGVLPHAGATYSQIVQSCKARHTLGVYTACAPRLSFKTECKKSAVLFLFLAPDLCLSTEEFFLLCYCSSMKSFVPPSELEINYF